ncbi:MAG: hypothetical protein JSV85_04505 [Candidatus Bathyarchaeota archaeon]|nr:MAG: hypothetical protein JSV85_04505 [Candidatus Bathyarchaeota archaeon]
MNSLPESQRLTVFIEYMTMTCGYNMSSIFSNLTGLITQWHDAHNQRDLDYTIDVIGPFTWHINPRLKNLVEDANDDYDNRNYELAISGFQEARAFVDSRFWQTLDYVFFIMILFAAAGGIIFLLHSKS